MPPRVAIITRTKDRPLLLKRALASVAAQTSGDWQQVIVNDGGDPEALEAALADLPEAHSERLKVIHHAEPLGMQGAANAGISASESVYICIHDDDDEWHPEYLEAVTSFLEAEGPDSQYQGVVCGTEEVRERVASTDQIKEISRKRYIPLDEISLFRMGYENPFPPIAFCYRRSAWEAVGPYDPRWDVVGDMDFNLRFLLKYEIGVLNRVLASYRIREESSEAMANSIREKKALHKRLFTEFKNTHLRKVGTPGDASLGIALNVAHYLVEAQWMLDDVFHRTRQSEEALQALSRAVALEGYEDRFETIRQGLAILVDHARDRGVREALAGLQTALDHAARARHSNAARQEELVRSLGLPAEGEAFETVRQALAILVDHARDRGVREALAGLQTALDHAARARQGNAARQEELVRSLGLPAEGEAFETVRQALAILVDHARDRGVREALAGLQTALDHAARARQGNAARQEELVRSVGLPAEGDRFETVRQALEMLLEHAGDGSDLDSLAGIQQALAHAAGARQATADRIEALIRSVGLAGGTEGMADVHGRLEAIEARLEKLENRSVDLRVGKLKLGTIGPPQDKGA